ncbi:MAG: P1 family peptidase [Oscillospiraceae bacterium]|nr:P1 family peptidase [Oscillospiraceae bacterium]
MTKSFPDNNPYLKEISIRDIEGIRIGNAEDTVNATGCTVIISEAGAPTGVDVRGGGPASRDLQLLSANASAERIHAVLLAGGSAYGLQAATGVMNYLEKKGIGYPVGDGVVPLVVQSDIFDLGCGSFSVRPDAILAIKACEGAYNDNYRDGCFGAGVGATVGKLKGMERCTKTGIGSYAIQVGEIKVGAVVCLNALGNIYDRDGNCIAGMRNEDGSGFQSIRDLMISEYNRVVDNKFTGNTTIGVIITNGKFSKYRMTKIASMAHSGYARAISPVFTSADGDTIYAMSTGEIPADEDLVGILAAEVMQEAIYRAVTCAESGYGFPAAKDCLK